MTIQPLVDPALQRRWEEERLIPSESAPPAPAPQEEGGIPFGKIAIGISAAYLAWRMWAKHRLQQEQPQTPKDAHILLMDLWTTGRKIWLTLSGEPIEAAYSVIPYTAGRALAIDYATELGKYINDTSADALMDGFAMQVNAGHNSGLAWTRSVEGYGLDTRQTKTFIAQLMKNDQQREIPEAIPLNAQAALDKAVLIRADRLGMNEAHKAVQTGKSMVWMTMAAMGDLPDGTRKKWVTAEDERVCAVCGPLDQVTIPLHWRFQTLGGEKFYAPGVHPNCRCDLELVYPERMDVVKAMSGDTWRGHGPIPDRDAEGQFAEMEGRAPKTQPVKPVTLAPLDPVTLTQQAPVSLSQMYAQAEVSLAELLTGPTVSLADRDTREHHIIVRPETDMPDDPEDSTYANVLFIPATKFLEQNGNPGLFMSKAGIGEPITFGPRGDLEGYAHHGEEHPALGDAFTAAFDDEAAVVGSRGLDYLRAAHDSGQDLADFSGIAPGLNDQKYILYRKAFAGLNKGQLMHLVQSALESSDGREAFTHIFWDPRSASNEEILKSLKDLNANEIATKILWAEKAESDENFHNATTAARSIAGTAWTQAANDVLNVATMSKTSKAAAFSGLGDNPETHSVAAVFRFPSGWMGDLLPWENASGSRGMPRGHYKVRNVTIVDVPQHLRAGAGTTHRQNKRSYLADEIDVIQRVALIDLVLDPEVYALTWDPMDPSVDVSPDFFGER